MQLLSMDGRIWLGGAIAACALTFGFDAQREAEGVVMRTWEHEPWHLQDGNRSQFNATGQVVNSLLGFDLGFGSGTLIRDDVMLTAAHVVDMGLDVGVRFGPGGSDALDQVDGNWSRRYGGQEWIHPEYMLSGLTGGADIALIFLDEPVEGARTRELYTGRNEVGKNTVFGGYGLTGHGMAGQQLFDMQKRAGQNTVLSAASPWGPVGDDRHLTFKFDQDVNHPDFPDWFIDPSEYTAEDYPLPKEATMGQGDSGGPMFIDGKLAGINSHGGGSPFGIGGYHEYAVGVRVSSHIDWIEETIAAWDAGAEPEQPDDPLGEGFTGQVIRGADGQILALTGGDGTPAFSDSPARRWIEDNDLAGEMHLMLADPTYDAYALGDWFQDHPDQINYGQYDYIHFIPEPGTLGMLAAGALGLLGRRRRRSHATAA